MGFKRKRSMADSPLSTSSFGPGSTPEAVSPTPFPRYFGSEMHMDVGTAARPNGWDFTSAGRVKSSDWGNRTRKRFRDNRPDERVIYETTLNRLFAAQRNHPQVSPMPSDIMSPQEPTPITSKPQKSTLHSFWKQLPPPPVEPIFGSILAQHPQEASNAPRCEDCDASLQSGNDSMDVDIHMDMSGAVESNPFACSDCGKNVCGTCAVVSTRRHCLQCTTSGRNSRRWW